jgi:hypothetical protein
MVPGIPRDEATEWLSWCQQYVDTSLDPLSGPLTTPPIRRPTWEEYVALENSFTRKLELAKQQRSS